METDNCWISFLLLISLLAFLSIRPPNSSLHFLSLYTTMCYEGCMSNTSFYLLHSSYTVKQRQLGLLVAVKHISQTSKTSIFLCSALVCPLFYLSAKMFLNKSHWKDIVSPPSWSKGHYSEWHLFNSYIVDTGNCQNTLYPSFTPVCPLFW